MKVETTAGQLASALQIFAGVIQRRNTIPVLSAVKFDGGKLIGTDLDIEATVTLPTIGNLEGAAAVDYFGLASLCRHIERDETVSLAEADGKATLSFNGSEYRMPSYPAADFPAFKEVSGTLTTTHNLGLIAAMRRVGFAISTEETRYYLNGVAIVADPGGSAVVAATDGHRLAMMSLSYAPEGAVGKILPRRLVHLMCRRNIEPSAVTFDADVLSAKLDFPGLSLSAKLIDGNYPDIFRVVPRDPKPRLVVERKPFLRALLRMRSFSEAFFPAVKIETEGRRLKLSRSSSGREAVEYIAIPEVSPTASWATGFNANYLIDALSTLHGETVTFASDDGDASYHPSLMTSPDDPLRVVIMPMRV